jgi:hypothetical protein
MDNVKVQFIIEKVIEIMSCSFALFFIIYEKNLLMTILCLVFFVLSYLIIFILKRMWKWYNYKEYLPRFISIPLNISIVIVISLSYYNFIPKISMVYPILVLVLSFIINYNKNFAKNKKL